MKPADCIKQEIESIRNMLSILGIMSKKMDKGETVKAGDLKKIINLLSVFVDQCHNKKEEMLLFPMLDSVSAEDKKHLNDLKEESSLGHEYMVELMDAVRQYQGGDNSVMPKIKHLSHKFIDLETHHLDEETQYLIPLLSAFVNKDNQGQLEKDFETMDNELFGKASLFQKAMSQIMGNLSRVYAGKDSHN